MINRIRIAVLLFLIVKIFTPVSLMHDLRHVYAEIEVYMCMICFFLIVFEFMSFTWGLSQAPKNCGSRE